MKFSAVLLAATLTAVASAQIADIPQCALTCFLSTPVTGCNAGDASCGCKAQAADCANGAAITKCVQSSSCSKADQDKAGKAGAGLCKSLGFDIQKCLPQPGGGTGTQPTPSTTPSQSAGPSQPTGSAPAKPTGCIPRYRARN